MKRAIVAACLALTLVAPAVAQDVPAPSRQRPAENTDEGGLWGISDRAEAQARASGQIERDAALNTYVREVACRVAAQYCGDVRVYVMNRPFFNASMAPNGMMLVWTGALLRARGGAIRPTLATDALPLRSPGWMNRRVEARGVGR